MKAVVRFPLRSLFSLWAPLFMLSALFPLTNWMANRDQVTLQDLTLPLILSLLTSIFLTVIYLKMYRRQPLAALIAAGLATLLLSHAYATRLDGVTPLIRAVNPIPKLESYETLCFSLFFVIGILLLATWIGELVGRFSDRYRQRLPDLQGGMVVAIAAAFLFQAILITRAVIIEWPQFFYRPPQLAGLQTAAAANRKPDIYYIVLDRYTSQSVLKDQFNFDNSPFVNFLNENQFRVDPNAHSNYPYTTMSIASTLNANYHTDAVRKFARASQQTVEPYQDSIRYASVIQALKQLGYTYDHLGTWYEASNQAPLADHLYQPEGQLTVFGHTFTLNTFAKDELLGGPYGQLVQSGLHLGSFPLLSYSGISESDATSSKLATLKQLAAQPAGGRFIFAHILVPHDPYYFNADGSLSATPGNDNLGEPIKQKYLGQVQYINNQMQTLISSINQHSNNQAVIILQADEGPYPMVLNGQNFNGTRVGDELSTGSMLSWSDQDLRMKYGILAAYHIPNASAQDLAQASDSVNIFRLIFNTYFHTQLAYLPRCYYAYQNGRERSFAYTDITQRLTGSANPTCPVDSNFGTP